MGEGAAVLDARGTLLYCNARMAQLLGAAREVVVGGALRRFIEADRRPAFDALLARGLQAPCAAEFTLPSAGGTGVVLRLALSPMRIHGRAGGVRGGDRPDRPPAGRGGDAEAVPGG